MSRRHSPGAMFRRGLCRWRSSSTTRTRPAARSHTGWRGGSTRPSPRDEHAQGCGGDHDPPGHGPHRYFFRLYALDRELDLPAGAGKAEVEAAIAEGVLASAELVGTYER